MSVLAERPTVIRWSDDAIPILHCDSGPAIAFRDGWQLWSLGNVIVDEQIVMRPETQTLKQIDDESNEEVKRIRIERYGWPRYIAETDATCIESRRNVVDGTQEALVQLKDGSRRMLCACRSTGRVYAIGVPREIQNCDEAQRWMAGGGNEQLRPRNIIGAS
jgi:hypothetical protein